MKKPIIILVLIVVLVGIAACVNFLPFSVHKAIIEKAHSFEPTSTLSTDQRFILKTERIEDESGVYALLEKSTWFPIMNFDEVDNFSIYLAQGSLSTRRLNLFVLSCSKIVVASHIEQQLYIVRSYATIYVQNEMG
jgi:hypothetical protein